jgi:hypothetical protein
VAERLRAVALPGHAPGIPATRSTRTGTASCSSETSFMCQPCSSTIPRSVGAMTRISRPHAQPA